jgi:formamidopyrimidine-DNA glycosylase
MPELPEVETVRLGLEPALMSGRLTRVTARRPDLRFPLPEGFVQRLVGARVEALDRRGKYILARLDSGETLIIHLGMTGRFEIEGLGCPSRPGDFVMAAPADPKHAHIVFETYAGVTVTYFDARRFGFMDLADTAQLASHPRLAGMGPEPLSDAFVAPYLARAFAGRKQGPKTLLLDQRIVAGLGNIYVSEALHRARTSPLAPAGVISERKIGRIVAATREVLVEAIAVGGSTLRDYAGADGALGYFQHNFRVYGRQGKPCSNPRCGGLIERTVQAGRSTFHCRRCQS